VSWLGCDLIAWYSRPRLTLFCSLQTLDLALLLPPETFGHLRLYRTSSHTATSTMAIQTPNATSLANPQPPDTLCVADLAHTNHTQPLPLDVIAEIIAHVR
jgi:hypothetical protein